ncbi:hypothetical protein CVU82_00765 [Candidatus Falkowbacteria bacterium HGW-Falkowbacteria-1]|jgi:hypothetical protein|uniref:Uncharacterized protein n=1 Tax=Candidatus Falkowbacteria bacterium HGW-Falkowbacteria-1 TaxID=2013768 RepID=A0A2N2EAF5_9BACT|nr:MAG: hypothetical protein CVU82_00765 [Candidatus Falkowbacteria bacterium HGW-Falkowbacteria-1]
MSGGKTKGIPLPKKIEQVQDQNQEPAQNDKPKSSPREPNKTLMSIRNVFLAFLIGVVPFVLVWIFMYFFNFDCPEKLKYYLSYEEWRFWTRLLISLLLTGITLKLLDSVAEEKNKFADGISKALLLTLIVFILWFYGISKPSREPQLAREASEVSCFNPNPFKDLMPKYVFTLNRGEKSLWIDFPAGYNLKNWGNLNYYKIIYKDGSVVTIDGNRVVKLPDLNESTQVRFESLSDGQTIYVYLTRIKR